MSQAGYTPIKLYYSTTALATPSAGNLTDGELALNTNDGKLYYKDNLGAVQLLASKSSATGSVNSVAMTVPTGLSVAGSPITSSGTLAVTYASGYSIPTDAKQANWDTAYSNNLQWNGGSTNLVAATGRTSLGATTIGSNLFTLTNPSAVTFPRFNADNSVSSLDAATLRTAISAASSGANSDITSITGLTTALTVAQGGSGATTAAGARTNFGATTIGSNLFTLTNPSAITFPQFNADNTVSALSAASFRTAIGVTNLLGSTDSATPYNTALGYNAGATLNSSRPYNVLIGYNAAPAISATGGNHVAVGYSALYSVSSGIGNVAVGDTAGYSYASHNYNVAIGKEANYGGFASNGTFVGAYAGRNVYTGTENVAVGYQSMLAGTSSTATGTTAVGYQSATAITTGFANTYMGAYSGAATLAGGYNTAIGYGAYRYHNGTSGQSIANTAIGYRALGASTGSLTGKNNTSIGYQSGIALTAGNYNVFVGDNSGGSLTTGASNSFIGTNSGYSVTTGSYNTIVGGFSGTDGLNFSITTASSYVVLSDGNGTWKSYWDNNNNFVTKVNSTAPTLNTNQTMTFELTSDTTLKIKVRGSDGVTRSVSLTLA